MCLTAVHAADAAASAESAIRLFAWKATSRMVTFGDSLRWAAWTRGSAAIRRGVPALRRNKGGITLRLLPAEG
jgi:hypothetical protein